MPNLLRDRPWCPVADGWVTLLIVGYETGCIMAGLFGERAFEG